MVIIISLENEASTNGVIDWLHFHGADFIRISPNTPLSNVRMILGGSGYCDIEFMIDRQTVTLSQITGVWYRRGWFQVGHSSKLNALPIELRKKVLNQLDSDLSSLNGFLSKMLFSGAVNKPSDNELNKLEALRLASSLGLSIPPTIVTSQKADVREFRSLQGRIITKNMSAGVFVDYKGTMFEGYTREVTEEEMDMLPEQFFPMLFQKLLNKSFEVRTYYLKGRMWSSAIFSQSSCNTKVDFRNYDKECPNRTPPYILPYEINNKLKNLMDALDLSSGSIDLVVGPDDNHVFLEVNPVGQFWQVSYPCNYYLEDEIARTLTAQ